MASLAVYTAADIPGELRVGIIYKDWPVMIPVGGRTSFAGDVLAVVVAETRQQARAAAELVDVEYDVLTPVTDPLAAIADDAPLAVWGTDDNVLSVSAYARGDVDGALGGERAHRPRGVPDAAHRARLPRTGVDAGRARPGGRDDARVLRRAGGVGRPRRHLPRPRRPTDRVVVELVSNGGAFGGKEDMSNQAQTALAAWLLGRPVKCTLVP